MIDIFPYAFLLVSIFIILDFFTLQRNEKSWFFGFLIIFLVFFAGLRGNIDNDYSNYLDIFHAIDGQKLGKVVETSDYLASNIEVGYRVLNYLSSVFTSNYKIIFFFSALLSVCTFSYVIFKISPYPFLSILLYFSHNFLLRDMMQIRSGIACSFCLLGVYFMVTNKTMKSYASILLGFTFHTVSISFIIFPILAKVRLFEQKLILFMSLFSAVLIALLFPLGNVFKMITLGNAFEKVSGYANNDYFQALSFLNPVNVKQILLCLICISNYERLKHSFKGFHYIFMSYFIGSVWWLLFIDFAIVAGRVSTVFTSVEIILVSILIKSFFENRLWLKFAFFILVFAYCCLDFYINIYARQYFSSYLIF